MHKETRDAEMNDRQHSHGHTNADQAIQSWVQIAGRNYTLLFVPEYDSDFYGYYNASVAEVPGCFSYGHGLMQAEERIVRALESHLNDPSETQQDLFVTVPNFDDELIPPGTLANIAHSVGLSLDELLTLAEDDEQAAEETWDEFFNQADVPLAA